MNPLLTLEQYLFLGSPLKITSEQNGESTLVAMRISPFSAFFESKDNNSQRTEALLTGASLPQGLDLL
ncbi:MAG: hypothetical protein SFU25_11440 [Candidatus Caenarcaniphilales bacterium]|nr:hypothetical protein [Candidatus Caenarcaniphilales bacterium]